MIKKYFFCPFHQIGLSVLYLFRTSALAFIRLASQIEISHITRKDEEELCRHRVR
jgi:hypothetical protein